MCFTFEAVPSELLGKALGRSLGMGCVLIFARSENNDPGGFL
jgi:hypothetical protein